MEFNYPIPTHPIAGFIFLFLLFALLFSLGCFFLIRAWRINDWIKHHPERSQLANGIVTRMEKSYSAYQAFVVDYEFCDAHGRTRRSCMSFSVHPGLNLHDPVKIVYNKDRSYLNYIDSYIHLYHSPAVRCAPFLLVYLGVLIILVLKVFG